MKKDKILQKKYLEASIVGFELAGSIAVGLLIGIWLDKQLDTKPMITLVFFFFGLAAGVRSVYRFYRKSLANLENDTNEP